jgi:LPXTG-site transpeptidase (sortase) family protein
MGEGARQLPEDGRTSEAGQLLLLATRLLIGALGSRREYKPGSDLGCKSTGAGRFCCLGFGKGEAGRSPSLFAAGQRRCDPSGQAIIAQFAWRWDQGPIHRQAVDFHSHSMWERLIAALQYACLGTGAILVSAVALARLDAEAARQDGIASFEATARAPDQSLWAPERVRDYKASLALVTDAPLAVLRIPDLGLEVPVYATVSDLHLDRGAGLIAGMGLPDKGGNLGIAGHRDGFFRVLKDVRTGQKIVVETLRGTHTYRVVATEVVDPSNLEPLADTVDPTITLVTCYPFYYLGHAPQRFIVRGDYEWT